MENMAFKTNLSHHQNGYPLSGIDTASEELHLLLRTLTGVLDVPHCALWFHLPAPMSLQDSVVMEGVVDGTTVRSREHRHLTVNLIRHNSFFLVSVRWQQSHFKGARGQYKQAVEPWF